MEKASVCRLFLLRPAGFEPATNGLEVRTGLLHANAADPFFLKICGVEAARGYI
jgi:hypothetical protein